jgi:hypothetical protein
MAEPVEVEKKVAAAIDQHPEASNLGPEGRHLLSRLLADYPELSIDEALAHLKEAGGL